MDIASLITLLEESVVLIVVFFALLAYAMIRGRHALMSLILGLYIALLVSLKFPYYEHLYALTGSESTHTGALIGLFALFTAFATFIFERLLFVDSFEKAFEAFPKKLLLALLGAGLVLAYSYHVLPLTNFVTPGEPVGILFAPEEHFFWWLIVPLFGLLIV